MSGKILLIDEQHTLRDTLGPSLRDAMFDVHTQMRWEFKNNDIFDCIVVHVTSQRDTENFKKLPQPDVPVFAIVSDAAAHLRDHILQNFADDIMLAPANPSEFLARLRGLIRRHIAKTELGRRASTNRAIGFNEATSGFRTKSACFVVTFQDSLPDNLGRLAAKSAEFAFHIRSHSALRQHLKHQKINTIVLDINSEQLVDMSNMVLDLRAHPNARYATIICFANDAVRPVVTPFLNLGADDIFDLSMSVTEIETRLHRLQSARETQDALRQSNQLSLSAAITDTLTGLFNRRYAMTHLNDVCARAREKSSSVAALMIDIDHFKNINDTYGHHVGDAVISAVANTLQTTVRASDVVARFGGEEFVVILSDISVKAVQKLADRLCQKIRKIQLDSFPATVTASIGISMLDYGTPIFTYGTQDQDLLIWADRALYQAKQNGRDQVAYYTH